MVIDGDDLVTNHILTVYYCFSTIFCARKLGKVGDLQPGLELVEMFWYYPTELSTENVYNH